MVTEPQVPTFLYNVCPFAFVHVSLCILHQKIRYLSVRGKSWKPLLILCIAPAKKVSGPATSVEAAAKGSAADSKEVPEENTSKLDKISGADSLD